MSAAQRTKPKPWVQGSGQAQQDCCGIKPVATEDPAISPGLSKGEPEASVVSSPSSATRCLTLGKAPPNLVLSLSFLLIKKG